jgi:two-component system, sensor histidine kinase
MPDDPLAPAAVEELRARLAEAEEALRAIRAGEVDGVIVQGEAGDRVYTLRSAEQPYRTLVEQMREGAAILTRGGDILYCNQRFAELAAVPLEEVIGSSVHRWISEDDREPFAALLAAGRGTHRGRLAASGGRGPDVYMSLMTTLSDDVERRTLIVADLSELAGALSGRARAERESRAKDQFMAMLAHELRNPLGAIAGAVQVLDAIGSPKGAEVRARAVITRQTQHLSRLIGDLLDAARVATGKITLKCRPVNWAAIVGRSIAILEKKGRLDRRIEVGIEPVWIDADADRIEQITHNLLGNAVKYTEPDGRIRVSLTRVGDDGLFSVADDGIGIARDLLPSIFDLFVQGDQPLDRGPGGLGIGLTVVRQLVELHGGSVSATSSGPGLGSIFTVRLPRIAAPAGKAFAGAVAPEGAAKRRILVVEDNVDSREMYRLVLELAGHEVVEAEDGTRGLELLRSSRPDVALVDLGLPGIDGYQVARGIRAEPDGHRVLLVALTGYGSADDRERSRQAGFDYHLVKPVHADALRELLKGSLPATEQT